MIRAAVIVFNSTFLSTIYGQLLINNDQDISFFVDIYGQGYEFITPVFNPLTFHLPMVAVDSFVIWLLYKKPVHLLTDVLAVIMSLSIISHTLGSIAWLTYNHQLTALYDGFGSLLVGLVMMAFAWGWTDQQLNRKRHMAALPRPPGLHIVEKNQ